MSLAFAVEKFLPSTIPAWMLQDHLNESGRHRQLFKAVEIDTEMYLQAQSSGELVFVTARTRHDASLVGYMAMLLRPHPHYRSVLVAIDDVHYLMPGWRGEGDGKRMIAFAEEEAARRGARLFSMRCKADASHAHIFEALGYRLTDYVFTKELSDAQDLAAE